MNAPGNVTTACDAVLGALSREVASAEVPDPPAWLALGEKLVASAEALCAVPDAPTAMPRLGETAAAMLDRVEKHATAGDLGSAERWVRHLDQVVALAGRMARVPR